MNCSLNFIFDDSLIEARRILRSMIQKAKIILNRLCRNLDLEDAVGEGLEGNKEHVIRNWKKGGACYLLEESLVKGSSVVKWKAGLLSDDSGYVAKEISKVLKVRPDFFSCYL